MKCTEYDAQSWWHWPFFGKRIHHARILGVRCWRRRIDCNWREYNRVDAMCDDCGEHGQFETDMHIDSVKKMKTMNGEWM